MSFAHAKVPGKLPITPMELPGNQRGAATLPLSISLLILISLVAAYTGNSVLYEQRISANDFRARQAFEAAETGLATAAAYISRAGGADKNDDGVIDLVFDTNGDGIGDVNTTTLADNSSVVVNVTGAFPSFAIVSTGFSDDRSAMQLVRAIGATIDALPNIPGNPLTARGQVDVNGSATVHNPEGASTIWSGRDVNLGSNNATATNIADPNDPGYPTCMDTSMTCTTTRSSTKVAVGLDVIENDDSLNNLTAEQMFQNFFGLSMANYRESRVTLEVNSVNANNLSTAADPGIHLGVGEVIWVDGDVSLTQTTTVGCEIPVTGINVCPAANTDPSITIIDGNLDTKGTPNFYGLLYVTGNMTMSGNSTVTGAMIVGGRLTSAPAGSLDIWFNSDMLDMTRDNGPMSASPGSWRDW